MMKGKAGQYYMGESKQVLLSLMDATPKDKLDAALKRFLEGGNSQDEASDIQTIGATSQSKQVELLFDIDNKSGLQQLGSEYYVDLDAGKDFMTNNIDTAKRVNDLEFSYKYHIVKNVVLNIPSGYKVSHTPDPFSIDKDGYAFRISYKQEGNKLLYRKEITIRDIYLKKSNFAEWNSDIAKLRKAYMEQAALSKL
jgi:hypothetical protein